jgi:hypothetical protein
VGLRCFRKNLAELDLVFAAQALDRGKVQAAVEDNPAMTPEERLRHRNMPGSRFYAGCLCNGRGLILEASRDAESGIGQPDPTGAVLVLSLALSSPPSS